MKTIKVLFSLIACFFSGKLMAQCTMETGGPVCGTAQSYVNKGGYFVRYNWDSLKITSNSFFLLKDSNATSDYMIVEVKTQSHQNTEVWALHSNWSFTKYNYNNYTWNGYSNNEDITYAGYKSGITIRIYGDSCRPITDTFYVYYRKICEYQNKSNALAAGKQEWVGAVTKAIAGNNARFWGNTFNQAINFTMDIGQGAPVYNNTCPVCSASGNVDSFDLKFYMDTTFDRGFYKIICNTPNNLEVWTGGTNRVFSHLSDGRNFAVKRTTTLLIPPTAYSGQPRTGYCNAPGTITYALRKDTGNLKADISFCKMDGDYSWGQNKWNAYVFETHNSSYEREVYQGWFQTDTDVFYYNWGKGQPNIRQQSCGVSMGDSNFTVRFLMKKSFVNGRYKIRVRSGAGGGTMMANLDGGATYYIYNTADYHTGGYDGTSSYMNLSGDTGIIIYLYKINGNTSRLSYVSCREPKNPGNITATRDTACVGGQVTLTVDTADGTETQWFKKACGVTGLYVGSGASITFTMDTSTTFYVRNRNLAVAGSDTLNKLDLYSPNCSSKRITVVAVPSAPTAPAAQSICSEGASVFTFSSVSAGSGADKVEWALTNTFNLCHLINSGGSIIDTVAIGKTDTIWLRSKRSDGGCVSSSVSTKATNNIQPLAPDAPAGQVICSNVPQILVLSNVLSGRGGDRIEWSKNSAFTTSVIANNGADLQDTVNPGLKDTIWIRSRAYTSGCISGAVQWINTVNAIDTAVRSGTIISSADTVCQGGDATLVLLGSIGTINWQKKDTASWYSIPESDTVLQVSSVQVNTQYRAIVGSQLCSMDTSEVYYLAVTTSKPTESNKIYIDNPVCGPIDTIHLKGLPVNSGYSFQWQNSTDGASFTNIIGATSKHYDLTNPAIQSGWFRRLVSEAKKCSVVSNSIKLK